MALSQMTEEKSRIAASVASLAPRLRSFVRRQVTDINEVDDIVQDTLLELVVADQLMEPIEHLAAWLYRVARNRMIDRFRARSRQAAILAPLQREEGDLASPILDGWLAPDMAGPDSAYTRELLVDQLLAALEELPASQRDVFVAHELDGRSFKDLATETGIAINTLLGRKRAAVQHLRRRLEDIHSEFDS